MATIPRRKSHRKIFSLKSCPPLAPIIPIDNLDDAIAYYNGGNFGLSSGIVTNNLELALQACRDLRIVTPIGKTVDW